MPRDPISVVIITKNEESNIEDCLLSCQGWAEEIIVVDDESTDKTLEIVKKYTDKIFQRKMDIEGRHRNWAYAQTSSDWVLSLDADERLTPELKTEIDQVLAEPDCVAYAIPRRNYISDYWLKYGGQYPSAQLRLFSKSKSQFKYEEAEVHPTVSCQRPTRPLKSDIIHYSYKDIGHFLKKMNGQTTLEAKKHFRTGKKLKFSKFLWRTIDRFGRVYYRKKASQDGLYGMVIGYFSSAYQMISYAKYWEFKHEAELKNNQHYCDALSGQPNFAHMIEDINKQTDIQSNEWNAKNKKISSNFVFLRALGRFIKTLCGRRGLRCGFAGFMTAYLVSFQYIISILKYNELLSRRN